MSDASVKVWDSPELETKFYWKQKLLENFVLFYDKIWQTKPNIEGKPMGFCRSGIWVMGYYVGMGFGLQISANQLGGQNFLWGLRMYGLSEVWVKRESTVCELRPRHVVFLQSWQGFRQLETFRLPLHSLARRAHFAHVRFFTGLAAG